MKHSVPRLIHAFKPAKYVLHLSQNPVDMTFSGSVVITARLVSATNKIILHSDGLNIHQAHIESAPTTVTYQPKDQTITLTSVTKISGNVTLSLEFSGVITKPMHGLYPCYFEHDGQQYTLLATQFESHHAREVFPCIDEPEAKAMFQLNIEAPENHVVISNMPVVSETTNGELKVTGFEESPIMSTYLLAWVSGNIVYEESTTRRGVQVRAYSTPVHAGKTAFALEVACKALDYMDDYFDIAYPLKKCDIVALPDFAAGAMENWGCITFRESAMLIDAEQSDLADKQHVADVVTHELAHQWFGNLVTMRWWEDLWLNEGFASWVPYLVLNDLFPEWHMWEQFSTGDLMVGMRADALQNTHPIVVEINNPDEIRSAFDSISYDKGCSVINLLFRYIGAEAFQGGLRIYLKEHAYANAETADLWKAWSKSSGKDVEGFMRSWTTKKGFPIVLATTSGDRLQLSQERFYLNKALSPDDTLWPIPLMQDSVDTSMFETHKIEVKKISKLNKGQSGFYRAIYDAEAVSTIIKQGPEPIDMLGLINDASEASKAGYHSSTDALELIKQISHTTNEPLLSTALGELAGVRTVLGATYEDMKPFVGSFVRYNLDRLGIEKIETDSVDDQLLRPMVVGGASYAGDKVVISWALNTFAEAKTPEDIRPDLRSVVYHTAVRELGDLQTYEKILSWYKSNTIPGEQVTIANALTSFRDPELIQRTLGYITTQNVKLQDSLYWIAYSLVGRHSRHLAWDWLKNNWSWVGENFGKEKEIDYYLRYAANGFASQEHLDDYADFFGSAEIFGSKRAFEQGKETIMWQSAWKQRDEKKVQEWLKSFN